MNRRTFTVLLLRGTAAAAAALLAALPQTAEAARGRRPRGPRRARGPTGTFRGEIAAVAGNTVRVNVGKQTEKIVIFWTDQQTAITGGGKRGTIADLQAGQRVTVKASDGRARSIEVEVEGEGKDKVDGKGKDGGERGQHFFKRGVNR